MSFPPVAICKLSGEKAMAVMVPECAPTFSTRVALSSWREAIFRLPARLPHARILTVGEKAHEVTMLASGREIWVKPVGLERWYSAMDL